MSIPLSRLREAGLIDTLLHLADRPNEPESLPKEANTIATMSANELVRLAMNSL
jgi:hypothetical protein